jgi:hypothetical protein
MNFFVVSKKGGFCVLSDGALDAMYKDMMKILRKSE